MNKFFLFLLVLFLSGCSFNLKTPVVANYEKLDLIHKSSKKDDVDVMLGTPQGSGVYIKDGILNELKFYFGFAGTFTTSTMKSDYGTAFISFKDNNLAETFYFKSKFSDEETPLNNKLDIKPIADAVIIGHTTFDDLVLMLGKPDFYGKRINVKTGITHALANWDASKIEDSGVMTERWLLVGYDNQKVIQDIVWVSSLKEDIQDLGSLSEQQVKHLYRYDEAGWGVGIPKTISVNSGNKIDATQVDAVIRTNPKNVGDIIKVIGNPTSIGFKDFKGDAPVILSNWTYFKFDLLGTESNFIPLGASEEQRKELSGKVFQIVDTSQSRLMVGHKPNGEVVEILWTHPEKR